jgi:hypothetical protein
LRTNGSAKTYTPVGMLAMGAVPAKHAGRGQMRRLAI